MAPQLRSRKIRSAEQFPHHLPQEIIEEILSRLPVKSLLRFGCVSKSWRSLIGSERFIKIIFENSIKDITRANWKLIIKYFDSDDAVSVLKQCSITGDPHADPLPIDDPINNHLMTGRVVGCCNGLLCILKKGCFFLWNPATRISDKLPKVNNVVQKYGFGWDERSDAYKLFAVVSNRNQRTGKVYSSKTNSWKTVEHGCGLSWYNRAGVFSGGNIYWIKESGDDIESFDLESEKFGRIDLPCKLGDGWMMLINAGGRLCFMVWDNKRTRIDGWLLKEESWVKVIPLKNKSQGAATSSTTAHCCVIYSYIESLVSPVRNEVHASIVERRPKRQKRRPARYDT